MVTLCVVWQLLTDMRDGSDCCSLYKITNCLLNISDRRLLVSSAAFLHCMYDNWKKLNTMSNQPLKLIIFVGSVREKRQATRVLKFMQSQCDATKWDVTVFDPKEMPFEVIKTPLHFYGPQRTGAPDWLVEAGKKVEEADAFLVITAEYNCSIAPALTNMLDHFPPAYFAYKPSAMVSYSMGIYGGIRAQAHLRDVLAELGTMSTSRFFAIPKVQDQLDEEGKPLTDHMVKGASRALEQLEWYGHAMRNHRHSVSPPQ